MKRLQRPVLRFSRRAAVGLFVRNRRDLARARARLARVNRRTIATPSGPVNTAYGARGRRSCSSTAPSPAATSHPSWRALVPDGPTSLISDASGLSSTHTCKRDASMSEESEPGVDLYWLPLGAGGHSVRLNGRVFEAVAARLERRAPCDLYHSALEVRVPEGRFVIEQAPIADSNGGERGVVAEGAVGSRWAGHFRLFRYEVRRWCGGIIPDVDEAVESPQRLTDDPEVAQRVLDLTPHVPTAVWGRDELAAGEMWNSNSIISWLIARSGLNAAPIQVPAGGRAPGWDAGLVVARRQETLPDSLGPEPTVAAASFVSSV